MIAPARQTAFEALCQIELHSAHSDDALSSERLSRLQVRDRNLVTEVVYGTLRWRAWLDHMLESCVARPWHEVDQPVMILLRLTLYQMTRMDRIPDHAAINDAVELAKRGLASGTAGFVNGVLRKLARERPWSRVEFYRDSPLWVRVSLPRWLWERWERRFGSDQACEFALSLNRPPRRAFRTPGESAHWPSEANMERSELVPGAYFVNEGKSGRLDRHERIQDEASQLIPYLLGSLEGAQVWDVCAAPGGKSAILSENCGPTGWVVSSDLSYQRASRMKRMMKDCAGIRSDVLVADARSGAPFRIRFDAILADVPCSGLGTLRRNPEIKWRLQPEKLVEHAGRQSLLLESVAAALRPGGRLLYSTCSTEPEENELVVRGFLQAHPEFRILRPTSPSGIDAWLDSQDMFRSYPGTRLWDGFFAALMVRIA